MRIREGLVLQDRGACHIHGTLWLGLNKIENLIRDVPDGPLRPRTKAEKDTGREGYMHGLTSAFRKFKKQWTSQNS